MPAKRNPGKLYCERCGKEITEGQIMTEDKKGYSHWKCKHPVMSRKMKSWTKK